MRPKFMLVLGEIKSTTLGTFLYIYLKKKCLRKYLLFRQHVCVLYAVKETVIYYRQIASKDGFVDEIFIFILLYFFGVHQSAGSVLDWKI